MNYPSILTLVQKPSLGPCQHSEAQRKDKTLYPSSFDLLSRWHRVRTTVTRSNHGPFHVYPPQTPPQSSISPQPQPDPDLTLLPASSRKSPQLLQFLSPCTRPSHSFSVPVPQRPLTADFRSALWKLAFNLGTCQGPSFLSCQRLRGLSEARILVTHPPWLPRVSHPLLQGLKHGTDQPAHFGGTHMPSSLESMIPCPLISSLHQEMYSSLYTT